MNQENFTMNIKRKGDNSDCTFTFDIEHVVPNDMTLKITDKGKITRNRIICYMYGRLHIDGNSYFTEVVNYLEPGSVSSRNLIVSTDTLFDETYYLSSFKSSDFNDVEFAIE